MEMQVLNATLNLTSKLPANEDAGRISQNTLTFVIGFGILILFVIFGVVASAFLCVTLKKDPYLWEAERERQLQEKADPSLLPTPSRERDKGRAAPTAATPPSPTPAAPEEVLDQESTQI